MFLDIGEMYNPNDIKIPSHSRMCFKKTNSSPCKCPVGLSEKNLMELLDTIIRYENQREGSQKINFKTT